MNETEFINHVFRRLKINNEPVCFEDLSKHMKEAIITSAEDNYKVAEYFKAINDRNLLIEENKQKNHKLFEAQIEIFRPVLECLKKNGFDIDYDYLTATGDQQILAIFNVKKIQEETGEN